MRKICMVLFIVLCTLSMATAASEEELFNRGVALLKEENPREAVKVFSQLIETLPDSPDAYRNRGFGYMKINRYDDAINDFQRAMELKPDLKDLYSNMGVALYYKKEYRKAIEFYDKELALRPDNHFCFFNRAICWAELKAYEKGLRDVTKSLDLYPDHYMALCLKGDLLVKTGRPGPAAQTYKKALKLNPGHAYAKTRLAALKTDSGAGKNKSNEKPTGISTEKQSDTSNVQETYEIQVSALLKKKNAEKLLAMLTAKGYPARILELTGHKGRQWFMVRIGNYDSKKAAVADIADVKAELKSDVVVRRWGRF